MWTLATLGRITLQAADGADLEELLRQPKRLALLVYLCFPAPGTWHRRDELVARFWPEFDSHRARTALRNAIYVLRKALGDEVIRGRGDEEISVDPAELTCDAAEFLRELSEGSHSRALERYQGDLLAGLFVPEAEGFEAWLEEERRRLRDAARSAALAHSGALEAQGDLAAAIRAARRAQELDGHDESVLRRLLALLDKTGDRAGALDEFERSRDRLRADLEVEPAPETMRLLASIRQRVDHGTDPSPDLTVTTPTPPPARPAIRARKRILQWAGAGLIVFAVGALGLAALPRNNASPEPGSVLLILPMENQSGTDSLNTLVAGLNADLSERLARVPGIAVRPNAGAPGKLTPAELARAAGAGSVLRSSLLKAGDSLSFRLTLESHDSGAGAWSASFLTHLDALEATASKMTAAVAGRLLGRPMPPLDRQHVPESYRLTLQGLRAISVGGDGGVDFGGAESLFVRAIELDPTNARAWTGMSSVWTSRAIRGRDAPGDESFARGEDAAHKALALDSTQGMAWGNLAVVTAQRDGNLAAGEAMFRRGMWLEPSNAELHIVLASVLRFAGAYDRAIDELRIAQRLDPLSPFPIEREAFTEFCAGRLEPALAAFRRVLIFRPANATGHRGVVRTLAALARWDEAIAAWKDSPAAREDSLLQPILSLAKGREGYWSASHAAGRRALPAMLKQAKEGWVAPMHVAMAWLKAGEIDSGLTILEREIELGARPLYRVHCFEGTDEVLDLPRFRAIARRIPLLGATVPR